MPLMMVNWVKVLQNFALWSLESESRTVMLLLARRLMAESAQYVSE